MFLKDKSTWKNLTFQIYFSIFKNEKLKNFFRGCYFFVITTIFLLIYWKTPLFYNVNRFLILINAFEIFTRICYFLLKYFQLSGKTILKMLGSISSIQIFKASSNNSISSGKSLCKFSTVLSSPIKDSVSLRNFKMFSSPSTYFIKYINFLCLLSTIVLTSHSNLPEKHLRLSLILLQSYFTDLYSSFVLKRDLILL